jgi:hypothetical protein
VLLLLSKDEIHKTLKDKVQNLRKMSGLEQVALDSACDFWIICSQNNEQFNSQ